MFNIWIIATFAGSILGLVISIKALIELKELINELKKLDEEQFVPEKYKASMLKFYKHFAMGITIISISELARIFLR